MKTASELFFSLWVGHHPLLSQLLIRPVDYCYIITTAIAQELEGEIEVFVLHTRLFQNGLQFALLPQQSDRIHLVYMLKILSKQIYYICRELQKRYTVRKIK